MCNQRPGWPLGQLSAVSIDLRSQDRRQLVTGAIKQILAALTFVAILGAADASSANGGQTQAQPAPEKPAGQKLGGRKPATEMTLDIFLDRLMMAESGGRSPEMSAQSVVCEIAA